MVIQFGLSLVIPLLFCLYACHWLVEHAGVGSWVFLIGLILGVGAGAMTYYKLYLRYDRKRKKGKKPLGFNEHV